MKEAALIRTELQSYFLRPLLYHEALHLVQSVTVMGGRGEGILSSLSSILECMYYVVCDENVFSCF